jgi:hypothetical protein
MKALFTGEGTKEDRGKSGLKSQLTRLFKRQLIVAAVLTVVLAAVFRSPLLTIVLAVGAGVCDNFLFLSGIDRGMQLVPAKSAAYMRWVMVKRIAMLLAFTLLALFLKAGPAYVLVSYLVFYVCLIIHMAALGIHVKGKN